MDGLDVFVGGCLSFAVIRILSVISPISNVKIFWVTLFLVIVGVIYIEARNKISGRIRRAQELI